MNHRAESNSNIEEELAKISLPNGITIRCGKKKIEITTEKFEFEDAFGKCYKKDPPKPVLLSPSDSSPSDSSPSDSSPSGTIQEKIERAIRILKEGCK